MAFRIRDLVINVIPEQGSPFFCTFSHCGLGSCEIVTICGGFSGCRECSGQFTCIGATRCGGCTLNVTGGGIPAVGDTPVALAALKAQLRQALSEVESAEQQLAERMRPQSVEEVEALEEKLQAALSELKTRKEQLLRQREAGKQD
jgi:hypothetical protein